MISPIDKHKACIDIFRNCRIEVWNISILQSSFPSFWKDTLNESIDFLINKYLIDKVEVVASVVSLCISKRTLVLSYSVKDYRKEEVKVEYGSFFIFATIPTLKLLYEIGNQDIKNQIKSYISSIKAFNFNEMNYNTKNWYMSIVLGQKE